MRRSILAALVTIGALTLGCEAKPKPAVDEQPPAEEKRGIEVEAPGVKVDVEPNKGVEVEAPGVDVDTKPKD